MEKTTSKINTEEIETPNWDKFDKKFALFEACFISIIGMCISLMITIYFLLSLGIKQVTPILSKTSLFFLRFGVFIIAGVIYIVFVFIQYKICDYWIYGYFLKKAPNVYKEYLECLEQEQYGEVY